jgi:hypothetical protein
LQSAFSKWILVLVGVSQSLAGLWLAPLPLLLWLLLRLCRPNRRSGRDRAPRLLGACVLARVPTGVADAVAWLEVAVLWLGSTTVVEVLIGWWRCTLGMSPNAGCSVTSTMVGRIWVDD